MTVAEVKEEVSYLTIENIRHFPCSRSNRDDFYSVCNKFGIEAARTLMIPPVWRGECVRPSEYFAKKK